ncbi:type I polyketide synthase [Aspergillus stella-maris]|uniref:type I polyketide synthase n=1 Tax=Aspergillus stella-maris TaxID=1810926 RepID=UPI003CCE3F0A
MNGHSNGHANGYPNGAVNTNGHTDTNGYSSSSEHESVPVAICSMAMRLPAGIRDDEALYQFLLNKGDARSVTPASRYNIDGYYDPNGKHGTVITKHGYFLDDVDFAQFDHSMFTAAAAEAELMDPNQRLILEVVREALERAGENWRGKPIGTYVGMFTEDWQEMHHKDSNFFHPYLMMGTLDFALANRISYEYDLRGPSVMYKTACSSAGVGLHEALEAIRRGHISSAIVAGTNLILAPGLTVSMSLLMALSPEGSSKSFDAAADGYARGEAVTALYIKRLDEAIRDGNSIRAVIRSSAAGADGRSKGGMANPNPDAHEAIIRKAYASVGLDMAQTAMVEAHGTGTPVGDPIEVEAIARCFGREGAFLGAVKPNLGHSEGAAAITSVMKAVLSLEHRTILPNIKFNNPNPAIPWDAAKLVVPVEASPWPEGRAERMSVGSYGIGGSNVHFIVDSAASFGLNAPKDIPPAVKEQKSSPALLLFSAARPEALKELVKSHSEYIVTHTERLADVAYTLAERREHLKYRGFFVVKEAAALGEPVAVASQGIEKAAFVFTGQGAQWVQMGRQLMVDYPSFLKNIQSIDQVLQGLKDDAPSWSIEDILFSCDDKTQLSKAELSQPLCTAIQIAVVDLLSSWGVTPSAVVGHSSGEIAAAYAAGALSKDSALIAAFYRGYVCKNPTRLGGMAAIGLGKAEVLPFLLPGVGVACENSGSSVTLSGDFEALGQVMDTIKVHSDQVFVRKLSVEMAYHSEHMKDVGDWYRELISKHLVSTSPQIPFYSSVYGGKVLSDESDFGPRYWQDNLENPVLFHDAVKSLLQDSPRMVHVEVGPHHALRGPLRQIYQETGISVRHIPTLTRGEDDTQALLSTVGQLYTAGVSVSLPCDPGQTQRLLSDLPAYPWHYERPYWAETRVMHNWRFRKHAPHDILGSRTLDSTEIAPIWRNEIRVGDVPWLKDHCVGTDIVFPAAGYISMAGEAVCQLENSPRSSYSYTVKEVELRQALVLQAEGSKEIVTSLRPQRLTATLDSDWYEFSIVSHDGSTWNKHCFGLVRRGRASKSLPESKRKFPVPLPRKVSANRWYTTLSRVGLNYGPRFTGLRNITAGVTERSAVLNITDYQGDGSESSYPLHPTTLDIMLQSWTVAAFKGIYSAFNTKFLPTFIKELYVGTGSGQDIRIKTTTASYYAAAGREGVEGESYGVGEDGENIFILKGFRGTPLPSDEDEAELTALQLQWKPDVSFLDAAKLTRPKYDFRNQIALAEKLYVLCALESNARLEGVGSTQPHFENYRKWMKSQIPRFEQPGYPLVDTVKLTQMSFEERQKLIPKILDECKAAGISAMAEAVWRTYDQVVNVFEGRTDFLDLLIHDGTLAGIYDWMNNIWDVGEFFQLLGHAQPQLRVLEIGAGTGGLTAKILQQLQSEYGERLYFQYTFTDVSSGFFVAAQERFKEYSGMEYKVLDISKDPLVQGFKEGEYDLIIASNVLHATPILHETLCNVRTLLSDHGRLFLQELSPVTSSMVYIMGLFVGWWLGEADGRAEAPYLPVEAWNEKLLAAGFNGCESVTFDNERPFHVNANIISRPAVVAEFDQDITLLSGPTDIHPLAAQVGALLQEQGCRVHHRQWDDDETSIPEQDMISFLDLDRPFLSSPREEDWDRFNKTIETLQQAVAVWLTNPAQVNAKDPHAATVLGMARTIRSELAMPLATMELEDWRLPGAAKAIVDVMRKIQLTKKDMPANLDPDLEYAWVNGEIHISRFHWYTVPNALRQTAPTPPGTKALLIQKRGLLQSLHWSGQPLPTLARDEVQVQVKAVGLNFTDVLIAMGLVHGVDALGNGFDTFGLEGAGIVSKIGSDINHVDVGDRVMILGTSSTGLATQVQRPGRFTLRIPNKLSFEDAATMPSVYVTVLLGLVDKAQLEKGQTILIHAAAGGIGIAAIHVARWIGAEIYCTVGSTEKGEFLMREFSIPRDRIFHSRDTSFYDDLMVATDGVGVDCVLNSVSGELLHTTWDCVAANGCMVEIGKRDMTGRAQLALDKFEDNRTFFGIDVSRHVGLRRATGGRLMELMLDLYVKGHIKPVHPATIFDATEVEDAFRCMQQGTHVGKIVVRFPENEEKLSWAPSIPRPSFRGDRTYLLVGGMGGLGRAIAMWMATFGAKSIIFLSRSAGKGEDDLAFMEELESMGCKVQAFAGDVADSELVNHIVATAASPIAGVMQMAMILRDIGVLDMDLETYEAVLRPRVKGTWNLHNALVDGSLDFFVLFSSVCGMVGYYGQANYAASNSFMDSFVQYRHNLGLTASVLDIGAVDDVGYISRTPTAKDTMLAMSGRLISEKDFLEALHLTISRSAAKPIVGKRFVGTKGILYHNPSHITQALECRLPIMDPQNNIIWKRDPRMAIYRNIETVATDSAASNSGMAPFLASVAENPRQLEQADAIEFLACQIRDRVAKFLMRRDDEEPMDLGLTLSAAGVDSLVAIELRNWWKQNLGVDVSVLELMNGGSIQRIGEMAAKRLYKRLAK